MTIPLYCKIQRETFNEVKVGFSGKITATPELVLSDFIGSRFSRCLLPPLYLCFKRYHCIGVLSVHFFTDAIKNLIFHLLPVSCNALTMCIIQNNDILMSQGNS